MSISIPKNLAGGHKAQICLVLTAFLLASAWGSSSLYAYDAPDDHHVIAISTRHGKVHLVLAHHPDDGHQHDLHGGAAALHARDHGHPDYHEAHADDFITEAAWTANRLHRYKAPLKTNHLRAAVSQAPAAFHAARVDNGLSLGPRPTLFSLHTVVLLI